MNAHHPPRRISLLALLLAVLACGGLRAGADDKKPALKVHPKIFSMIQGWLSDGESPVVTEVNLDAVAGSRNQFDPESVKLEDGWTRCPGGDGAGFMRYRVLESKGPRFTVEYQDNGGGSLTTAAIFEVSVEKREIRKDGKPATIQVLRVLSYRAK
jgi:hypothetical protein